MASVWESFYRKTPSRSRGLAEAFPTLVGAPLDNIRARLDEPSQSALDTYADIQLRWDHIRRCKAGPAALRAQGVKRISRDFAAWSKFEQNWEGGYRDTAALSAQVSGLNRAQEELRSVGLAACTLDGAPQPAPDIEESADLLQTSATVDKTVRSLGLPENLLDLAEWWDKIPSSYKLAGGAVVGLWTLSKVARIFGR